MFTHLSRRRRTLFAGAAVLLLAIGVFVAVRVVSDRPAPPPGLVVLVPGYGGSTDSLRVLADRIAATGRETRMVSLPSNGTGDLLAQVAALDQVAGGSSSVDVIGFSAGGVVARLWVARGAHPHQVISLGSPFRGTRLAATGGAVAPDACPVACQQLAPGSALLNSIREPVPVAWLSLWTENDQTVQPPDSSRLAGAINVSMQELCPGIHIEHGELPTHALPVAIVLDALTRDRPTHPAGDVRCP